MNDKNNMQELIQFLDTMWKPWFEAKFETISQKIDSSNGEIKSVKETLSKHDGNIKELYGRVTAIENKESKLEGSAIGVKLLLGGISGLIAILGVIFAIYFGMK